MKLCRMKVKYGWTDKSFTDLLKLMRGILPPNNELPNSMYEAKKILCPMGMDVKKIHARPNDSILFRNDNEDLHVCPKCGASRYKPDGNNSAEEKKKRPPAKVVWYLPIVERFKCLYANVKDAKYLRWHAEWRKSDGMLRHPSDSPQWRSIDGMFPEFGAERKYIMLYVLISGPKEPGNNIDVYLQPLIEDLKLLWDEGTLLNLPGKTKDGIKARLDMQEMGIRKELAPQVSTKRSYLPSACNTLSRKEKISFCKYLSSVKAPHGYSSNIKKLVSMKDLKLVGLKSHDCHVLLQQLLPIAIQGILPKHVRFVITKLCLFFNTICSKVIDPDSLDKLQVDIISRYRPEGSIVEAYYVEEVIEFYTDYLASTDPIGIPRSRHEGRLQGHGTLGLKMISPGAEILDRAHLFVLQHMTEVNAYLEEPYGPGVLVRSYESYDVNGYTFYTKYQDRKSAMQNSGVCVGVSSTEIDRNANNQSRDVKIHIMGLLNISGLDYKEFKIALFKCKWFNIRRGVRVDELGFTLVDFSRFGHEDDPFILATQVKQVFYIEDRVDSKYSIVVQGKRRILGIDDVVDEDEYNQFNENPPFSTELPTSYEDENFNSHYIRKGGYDEKRIEWQKEDPIAHLSQSECIDPSILSNDCTGRGFDWIRARLKKKEGEGYFFPKASTKEVFEKMVLEQVAWHDKIYEGSWSPHGHDDILTRALEKKEHGGHVRGVGGGACIRDVFGSGKNMQNSRTIS
ncbi:uncharacterized protein LOC141666250 [Apium graveolens]|uniref:uncharacterized protein LOC141666250 n=1 Tax=Apium graveolens TaxID=4045 RepID=UPI003D7B7495